MIFLRDSQRFTTRATFVRRYRCRTSIGFLEVIVAFRQAVSQSDIFTTIGKVERAIGRLLADESTVAHRRDHAAAVRDEAFSDKLIVCVSVSRNINTIQVELRALEGIHTLACRSAVFRNILR